MFTRLLGFLYKIFLSRTLSTETLGIYSIVASVFMVFVTILSSGIPLAVSKTTATHKTNQKQCNGSVISGLIISLIICLFITLIILVGKQFFVNYFKTDNAYTLLLLLIPAIIFTAIYSPFKGFLWGKERFLEVSLVEFLEQIIRIGCYFLCCILIEFSNPLSPVGISASIACVISTIIGIIFYLKNKGWFSSPKSCFKPVFASATPVTLVRLTTSLMQPFMAFVLPLMLVKAGFSNEQALSQLGIAMGMTLPLLTIPSTLIGSLAMAITPNLTSLHAEGKQQALTKQITYSITFTICCSFIIIPFFISLGEQTCLFVYDNIIAGTYLKNCCWLIVPMGLSQITSSILNSLNLETKTFKYYLYSCVVLILCIILLPKHVGVYALMYGMGLSTLLVAILNIVKINKVLNNNKTFIGLFIKLIIITIPTTYLTKWTYNLISFVFPNFLSLIICATLCVITFTVLMTLFNIVDVSYIKSVCKTKIKKASKSS